MFDLENEQKQLVTNLDPSNSSDAFASSTGLQSSVANEENVQMDSANKGLLLASEETRRIRKLRILFLLIVLCIAILSFFSVLYFCQRQEEIAFEKSFETYTSKVITSIEADAAKKTEALDSLSNSITLQAQNMNLTWPFVTIPKAGRFFETYLTLTHTSQLSILPIIKQRERREWELYSVKNQGWIPGQAQGRKNFTVDCGLRRRTSEVISVLNNEGTRNVVAINDNTIIPFIHVDGKNDTTSGPWIVSWQYTPVTDDVFIVNYNHLSEPGFDVDFRAVESGFFTISPAQSFTTDPTGSTLAIEIFTLDESLRKRGEQSYVEGEPLAFIRYPIFNDCSLRIAERKTVAILSGVLHFKAYFDSILTADALGIFVVLENSKNQTFTFRIDGETAKFVGEGDLHDPAFDKEGRAFNFTKFVDHSNSDYIGVGQDVASTQYMFVIYPSAETKAMYITPMPYVYSTFVLIIFAFTATIFLVYNWYVEQRQRRMMKTAITSTAVLSSMFPAMVRDRLYEEVECQDKFEQFGVMKRKNGDFLHMNPPQEKRSEAIADFYPETTILFADICGFTGWCSVHEPTQVFHLLECIYSCYDSIAKRLRVFKVETVGDCYVAACGLPEKRKTHAIVMARFARECLQSLDGLLAELQVKLGPDVSTLSMRFGMHSGPVTAGVIRGDNARFQLFGDTVNTAARMESTCLKGRIQLSKDTADLLIAAGKSRWLQQREDKIFAKGKGQMTTYFLLQSKISDDEAVSVPSSFDAASDLSTRKSIKVGTLPSINSHNAVKSQEDRTVQWAVDILYKQLQKIAEIRGTNRNNREGKSLSECSQHIVMAENGKVIDEVKEVIAFPVLHNQSTFDAVYQNERDLLDLSVRLELSDYVKIIASMYSDRNHFHNFQHAAHVAMSVQKLLSRVVIHSIQEAGTEEQNPADIIALDPLTQFACAFSALIHDCDHRGVSNGQLVKEKSPIATFYKNRSVAEQNSVDLAWGLLMKDSYNNLRSAIYSNQTEKQQFRQLVVNCVMATDIFDREMNALRNTRWDKSFATESARPVAVDEREEVNRKATIIVEHLMQASDVSHTMQHWQIYRRWNEAFFMECSQAFMDGRAEQDPATNWYQGEIKFFDSYIIPLAKKLKDCGVFGVSSNEYLSYAETNRMEWEQKGQEVVAEMIEKRSSLLPLNITDGSESENL